MYIFQGTCVTIFLTKIWVQNIKSTLYLSNKMVLLTKIGMSHHLSAYCFLQAQALEKLVIPIMQINQGHLKKNYLW